MKVILEPKVTVVAVPQFIPHPEYEIPDDGTDSERLGAFAAKGCYDSYGKTGRSNIENQAAILEHAHGSVIEHAHVSLFIEGITRGLSLELNRHRPFNISQRSTRYTKEEDSAIVLEPYYAQLYQKYIVRSDADIHYGPQWTVMAKPGEEPNWEEMRVLTVFLNSCQASITAYSEQVYCLMNINPNKLTGFDLRKFARGKARNLLPHSLETRGTWTANFRAFRWFIESRSSRHAEPEIRVLADKVLTVLRPLAPTYWEDFHLVDVYDGINEWRPEHSKV